MLYSRAVEGLNSNSPMRIALFLDRDDDLGIIFSEYGNYILGICIMLTKWNYDFQIILAVVR